MIDARDDDADGGPAPPRSGRWRPQFGLWALLGVMAILSPLFAVWGGLMREGASPDDNPRLVVFVLLVVATPLAVMIAVSLIKPAQRLWHRLRRHRR
jgi:hypothetical protein